MCSGSRAQATDSRPFSARSTRRAAHAGDHFTAEAVFFLAAGAGAAGAVGCPGADLLMLGCSASVGGPSTPGTASADFSSGLPGVWSLSRSNTEPNAVWLTLL